MIATVHEFLSRTLSGRVEPNAPLAPLTTYLVGGPADLLVTPADEEDVRTTLEVCRIADVPITVIGAGSNLLVADEGIRGVVLRTASGLGAVHRDGDLFEVGAGVADPELADLAAAEGVAGFVFLADLPGTLGGAVVMNAGNNDGEVRDILVDVTWLDRSGHRHVTSAADCTLGYRTSLFHGPAGDLDAILVSARLRADRHDRPDTLRRANEDARRIRRGKFPTERANCGSVFKRPPGDYAGRLIEAAGCKGLRVGQAKVSETHAGFVVNLGGATAVDVRAVIAEVQRRVREHAGVMLEREVIYLGEPADDPEGSRTS